MTAQNDALLPPSGLRREPCAERRLVSMSGYPMAFMALVLVGVGIWRLIALIASESLGGLLLGHVAVALAVFLLAELAGVGLYTLEPNESAIVTLFGHYGGTD